MRLAAIHPPRKKPKRCIASYPYWEHEGVNRHDEGRTTDSVRWYIRIKKRAIYFTAVTFAYLRRLVSLDTYQAFVCSNSGPRSRARCNRMTISCSSAWRSAVIIRFLALSTI